MSLSHFVVLSTIGKGSYSTVLKVRRISDNQVYALKKIPTEKLSDKEKKFALNEIRFLASITHPNIIAFKEAFFDEPERCLCLVLEFADSGDLFQRIRACQEKKVHLNERFVWSILIQITQAAKALHDLGIIHRDLKSANVFLNKDGVIKLGDLNVSKVAKNGFLKTQTGTPYYASPEVWKDSKYSNKSDIWSLGCIIYEALCLKPPFRGVDMTELFSNVIIGKYPSLPKIYSAEIDRVLSSLLNNDPNLRPSCEEILEFPEVKKRIKGKNLLFHSKSQLLSPIKLPKILTNQSLTLPRTNYEKASGNLSPVNLSPTNLSSHTLSTVRSEIKLPRLKFQIPKKFCALRRLLDNSNERALRINLAYLSPINYHLSPKRARK